VQGVIDSYYHDMLLELSPGHCKALDPSAATSETDSLGFFNSIPLFILVFVFFSVGGIVHLADWWWQRTKKMKEEKKSQCSADGPPTDGLEVGGDAGSSAAKAMQCYVTYTTPSVLTNDNQQESTEGESVILAMLRDSVYSQADTRKQLSELAAQMTELAMEVRHLRSKDAGY